MSDSTDRVGRRTFLYGAGSIALTSVLAGCSGGSSDDNGTAGGTTAGGETAAATDAETAAATETGTTESGVGDGTDLESPATDAETETGTESTATETDDDTEAGGDSGTETEAGTTDSDGDDEDDESGEGRGDSERLTYGEIRQQPPDTLDSLNQEYVELINASGSAIDLSGYTITYGKAEYTFDSGFELGVGDKVTVHTGSGDDSDTDVYVGRDEVALDYQGPDDVTVRDADGNVVLEATA